MIIQENEIESGSFDQTFDNRFSKSTHNFSNASK